MTVFCLVLVAVAFALWIATYVLLRRCEQRLAEAKSLREDSDWMLHWSLEIGDRAEAHLNESRECDAHAVELVGQSPYCGHVCRDASRKGRVKQ